MAIKQAPFGTFLENRNGKADLIDNDHIEMMGTEQKDIHRQHQGTKHRKQQMEVAANVGWKKIAHHHNVHAQGLRKAMLLVMVGRIYCDNMSSILQRLGRVNQPSLGSTYMHKSASSATTIDIPIPRSG